MDGNRKKFIEEYSKELLENSIVINLFKDYNDYSLKDTVRSYANRIFNAGEFGDMAEKLEKDKTTQFIDDAFILLEAILIIKIFHKECEWRAGLFNHPDITVPQDFMVFTADPFNCNFISPIAEHEVRLMQNFIATDDFDFVSMKDLNWLYYDEIRQSIDSENADGDTYPEWFSYYDLHMGTTRFINLPNIRGEKISRYANAYYTASYAEIRKSPEYIESQKNIDRRSILPLPKEPEMFKIMDDILQSKEKKIKLKYYDLYSQRYQINEDAMNAIHYLSNFSEVNIPIKAADTWQEGLIKALDDFNRKGMIDALPEAFNNYKTQLELNIKSNVENEKDIAFRKSQAESAKNHILKGCKILGEPENFDFLNLD